MTKNAILLVDYTNTLRERGLSRTDAILEAGPTRLRPILMTTIAMIFGMLPTALGLGRGAEFRAPLATRVMIGGLILSTMLTLLVIPCVYTYFDDFSRFVARTIFHRRLQPEPAGLAVVPGASDPSGDSGNDSESARSRFRPTKGSATSSPASSTESRRAVRSRWRARTT